MKILKFIEFVELITNEPKIFKNKNFIARDYEITNVVFCEAKENPDESHWELSSIEEVRKMNCGQLFFENGIRYYGYL